jgi:tRNA G18 (ribose-2'-O)-methylase SpoU
VPFEEIRKLAQANRISVQTTDEKEIAKLLKDDVSHQGIIALSKPFEYTNFDEWTATIKEADLPTVIILDHIQDVSKSWGYYSKRNSIRS